MILERSARLNLDPGRGDLGRMDGRGHNKIFSFSVFLLLQKYIFSLSKYFPPFPSPPNKDIILLQVFPFSVFSLLGFSSPPEKNIFLLFLLDFLHRQKNIFLLFHKKDIPLLKYFPPFPSPPKKRYFPSPNILLLFLLSSFLLPQKDTFHLHTFS